MFSKSPIVSACFALASSVLLALPPAAAARESLDATNSAQPPATRPLVFEQNLGQLDADVDFVMRAAGYTGFLSAGDLHLRLEPSSPGATASGLVLEVRGGDPATARGATPLESRSNYLRGADPKRWIRDIPHFARVQYPAVYPGIDMVYRNSGGALEYDFVIGPGADPARIELGFQGADSLALDTEGRLIIETPSGPIRQAAPIAFQHDAMGDLETVEVAFTLTDDRVAFELGAWDPERELVIDPLLQFSTFLGGALADVGNDVALDSQGDIYVVGWTHSDPFPVTPSAYQTTKLGGPNQGDLFLSKFNSTGTTLLYSTYLGANSKVIGKAVAVDDFGQAYVLAHAGPQSSLFTSANAVQSSVGNIDHTYVAKFNDTGSNILYATFLSGPNGSTPGDVGIDGIGNIYVAGSTKSLGFPLLSGYRTTMSGVKDIYLVKVDPMASYSLQYATYFGGYSGEAPDSMAVDPAGRVYLTGYTYSPNFPVKNAIQPAPGGGYDAFAAAFDPTQVGAASLMYSTYLGGNSTENGSAEDGGIAVDALGYATIGGTTTSANLPTTTGTVQPAIAGSSDAFIYRLDPAGALVFATYFGGSGLDQLKDLDIDADGRIALFGYTLSTDLPVPGAFQPNRTNSADLFLTVLSEPASSVMQGSYLGGYAGSAEHAGGVILDAISCTVIAAGNAEAGSTADPFPTTLGSYQPVNAGGHDAFLLKWPYCIPNQPPVAVADSYTMLEDDTLTVAPDGVLANDTDAENDPLTAILNQGPVTLLADGSFTYSPPADWHGQETFTYVANDGQASSAPALVTIEVLPVNDPPVALPDNAGALAAQPVAIDVLANDSDIDGGTLTVINTTQGSNGSVTILPNGEVQYVSIPGFVGVDTFIYTVSDGLGGTALAVVSVGVEPGPLQVPVDAVPFKCPNPIHLRSRDDVTFVIVSTPSFNAVDVDPASVEIFGLKPYQWGHADSATPYVPYIGKSLATDCNSLGADGLEDFEGLFKGSDLLDALETATGGPLFSGQVIVVPLTGKLLPAFGGIDIVGEDIIVIQ